MRGGGTGGGKVRSPEHVAATRLGPNFNFLRPFGCPRATLPLFTRSVRVSDSTLLFGMYVGLFRVICGVADLIQAISAPCATFVRWVRLGPCGTGVNRKQAP